MSPTYGALSRSEQTKSVPHGASTLGAEVTNIDGRGIWLLINGREYFLPYAGYPWFKDARVSQILHVELHHGQHLYWPDLDVDLEVDAIEHPEKYPLIAKTFR